MTLLCLFVLLVAISTVFSYMWAIEEKAPYGYWDAWAQWIPKANFLYRSAGQHWKNVAYSIHGGYPLLLPGFIAACWTIINEESTDITFLTSILFTLSTALLLYGSIGLLRSRLQGLIATLLLLGTPFFLYHGTWQYADIPVSFFYLAGTILLVLADVYQSHQRNYLLLAGFCLACSVWTKNEAFIFFATISFLRFILGFFATGSRVMCNKWCISCWGHFLFY